MDTRHIRTAVAVARCGTFTAAARELFMSQSTLSRQVAALERDLGGQLFVRGARRVELTARGTAFMGQADLVLQAVEAAEAAVRRASAQRPPQPRCETRMTVDPQPAAAGQSHQQRHSGD